MVSGTQASQTDSSRMQDIEDTIHEALADINMLVLFLSHPDQDHINFLKKKSIRPDLTVLAYLGGHFLGKEDSHVPKKVVQFLSSRSPDNTWVEFPFYWGWNLGTAPFPDYQQLRKTVVNPDLPDDAWQRHQDALQLHAFSYNPEVFFQGDLQALLAATQRYSPKFKDFFKAKRLEKIPAEKAYVWGMNYHCADVNAQSYRGLFQAA